MSVGFDHLPINHQLLLGLPFCEGTGAITRDVATPHHELTLVGAPTWGSLASGFPYIDLDGTEHLEIAAADSADLNFTSEDFALKAWLYNVGPTLTDSVMCQGVDDTDGWELLITAVAGGGDITLRTNQAAAHTDLVALGGIESSAWTLVGVSRSGTGGQFYINGEPVATTGALTDAISVAAGDKFYIGVDGSGVANFWDGNIAFPEIWGRELTYADWKFVFATERHWFGV